MIDRERLAEARQSDQWGEPHNIVMAAVDAVLEADQFGWCTNHRTQSKNSHHCLWDALVDDRGSCQIISVVVVPVEEQP